MFRATFTAFAVTAVLLMGSILVIPISSGTHSNVDFANVSPLKSNSIANTSELAYFTVYVPDSPFDVSVAQNAMSYIGVTPQKSGFLWTFSVPGDIAVSVNNTLHKMTEKSGISFFFTTNQSVVTPSISYSYAGQNLNIPFAYTPDIISRAYNFTWALSHGINGSGITIGIVDAYGNPNIMYDLRAFDSVNGLPPVNLTIIYPDGQPGSYNSTWAMETSTDVEWAHALAPAAKIVLLVATSPYTSDLQNVVSYAVSHPNIANILSLSWGTPESGLPVSSELTYSHVYSQAALNGMTVLAASGDFGAYAGGSQLSVEFPSSDPNVTGIGGTSLYSFNGVFRQTGWGGVVNGQSYGSGGGYSSLFRTPYWQSVKGYNNAMRGVPDVALDANKYTGVYVISSGGQYIVGGTSVSTPIWADVVALMEQYTGVHFPSVNPLLYQIARTPLYNDSFTQILSGTNGYYVNTPYWNPVTGLGTPKVSMLINVSKEILDGYGGIAVFNGSRSYNATGISMDLNITPQQGRMENNGTTFYYDGFYTNAFNFVKFGVTLNTTGEALRLVVSQGGSSVTRSYDMPAGYSGKLTSFRIGVSYDASSLTISTSGGFTKTLPAFLDFSGEMSPAAGTSQYNSPTNLTVINPGNFSLISVTNGTGTITPSYVFFQHYNHIGSKTYSTIDAAESSGQLQFFSSHESESGAIGTSSPGVEILYQQSFSYPTKLQFYLQGGGSSVSWSVNSTSINGDVFYAHNGGIYPVNATFTNANQVRETITRNVSIPNMHLANVSVNYTIKGSVFPGTEITSMWFYSYAYNSPDMQIPAMNATNEVSAVATGFYGESTSFTGDLNFSLKLTPMKINVSLFVFNTNASVTFNNHSVAHTGGIYYESVLPGQNLVINVSKSNYVRQTQTIPLEPGDNVSLQMDLPPVSSGTYTLTGKVSDYIFAFPIGNALVRLNPEIGSYTNSTGVFFLYPVSGRYSISASANMYENFSTPLNISASTVLDIKMIPAKISVNSEESVSITHYFPLLFYFGYISWTPYKGGNFSMYQVYVSTNQNFLSPKVTTVLSKGTGYAFLSGLAPGHTYYVSVVLRLSNSQVYQSQVVKITYTNPIYLGVNLVILGAIGFYVYMAYRVFVKKKDKDGIQ